MIKFYLYYVVFMDVVLNILIIAILFMLCCRDSILQSRESFLAWNENYPASAIANGGGKKEKIQEEEEEEEQEKEDIKPPDPPPPAYAEIESPGKPLLIIDIQKTAFFLGQYECICITTYSVIYRLRGG